MNKLLFFSILIGTQTAVASGCAAGETSAVDARVVKLLGGELSVAVIRAPDKVEAYRIESQAMAKRAGNANENGKSIAGHAVLSGPVAIDQKSNRQLSAVLLDADSYEFDRAKGCIFAPGVVVRFARKSTVVDVLFCFSCDELAVFTKGRRGGTEDFDAVRGRLLAVVKRAFPEDAEIQGLK